MTAAPSGPVLSSEVDVSACDDLKGIAREILDLEVAGLRWQGGSSPCLRKVPLKLLRFRAIDAEADPALLDPEYVIPAKRKIEFKAKRMPNELVEVNFNYIGVRLGKEYPVKDQLILKLNFNQALKEKGCASVYRPPEHFVMRKECKID